MTVLAPSRLSQRSTPAALTVAPSTGSPQTKSLLEAALRVAAPASLSPAGLVKRELSRTDERPLDEKLFDARAFCKITTRQFAMHFDRDWHTKFFKQLDQLMDVDEWDSRDQPVTKDSFYSLIRLLLMLKGKKRPGLGIANHGNIIASWSRGRDDRLTVECLPGDRVRWLVTMPIDSGSESAAGETALDRLLANIEPYNPSHWFDDEGAKSSG